MKNVILILILATSFGSVSQSILDRFEYTNKKEYLCIVDNKKDAIDMCYQLYELNYGLESNNEIVNDSKVPIFWVMVHPDTKSKVVVIYCISHQGEYDVVYKQMKNKDTYFFSFEDYDGETYDLIYNKQ